MSLPVGFQHLIVKILKNLSLLRKKIPLKYWPSISRVISAIVVYLLDTNKLNFSIPYLRLYCIFQNVGGVFLSLVSPVLCPGGWGSALLDGLLDRQMMTFTGRNSTTLAYSVPSPLLTEIYTETNSGFFFLSFHSTMFCVARYFSLNQ